jgi:hypothetical protein
MFLPQVVTAISGSVPRKSQPTLAAPSPRAQEQQT